MHQKMYQNKYYKICNYCKNTFLEGESMDNLTRQMYLADDDLMKQLYARKTELEELIVNSNLFLAKAPAGTIRIETGRKSEQYYQRTDPKNTHGVYIKKSNTKLIRLLLQKEYTKKLRSVAQEEYKKLARYLNSSDMVRIAEIYTNLAPIKQNWIKPYILPNEQFLSFLEKQSYTARYQPEDEDTTIITERGEAVRSKSEKILADKFFSLKIPYYYEK